MSEQDKDNEQPKYKITFAPGCFDDFEGTQEELDALVTQLTEMAESGELLANSMSFDSFDELEEIDEEVLELLPMLTAGNIRH